jgi:hypothetical protein
MACASAVTPTQRPETAYIPGGGSLTITPGSGAISATLAAPLTSVWYIIPTAFDSLGLQLSLIDPKRHVIGNEGIKLRSKLGKERLSTYLECGTTQVGPNADSYEVILTVMTQLEPSRTDSTQTHITINTSAVAKPLQFSQDYSRCSSKGILEERLLDVISGSLKK